MQWLIRKHFIVLACRILVQLANAHPICSEQREKPIHLFTWPPIWDSMRPPILLPPPKASVFTGLKMFLSYTVSAEQRFHSLDTESQGINLKLPWGCSPCPGECLMDTQVTPSLQTSVSSPIRHSPPTTSKVVLRIQRVVHWIIQHDLAHTVGAIIHWEAFGVPVILDLHVQYQPISHSFICSLLFNY